MSQAFLRRAKKCNKAAHKNVQTLSRIQTKLMTDIPLQFQTSVTLFYTQLDNLIKDHRFNITPAVNELRGQIMDQPDTQTRAALCWFWWQYVQENTPDPMDQRPHYTHMIIKSVLQPLSREVLEQCGVELFDRFQDFWDVDGFNAAIDHEHWSGAAYILRHALQNGLLVVLSDERRFLLHETLDAALKKFGCDPVGTLGEKRDLVAQQLDNRLTQIVLREAVEDIELQNTSARKM